MAKNRSEKKMAKKADSNPEQPYAVEINMLRIAHSAFLAKAWECYKDPVFVYSMMHTVHHAMMDLERSFLEAKAMGKINGKKRDA